MNYYYPPKTNSQSKSIWVLDAISATDRKKNIIRNDQFHVGMNVVWGLGRNNFDIVKSSSNYFFSDMPYWGRWSGDNRGSCYWRVIPNALHCNWIDDVPSDRFNKLNVLVKEQRKTGNHILLCPSSVTLERFYDETNWTNRTIAELRNHTDRPIRIRRKPRARGTSGPSVAAVLLDEDLRDAWAVVTLASIVGVEALCEGIPVFCHKASPCAAVANLDLSMIENPKFEHNQSWLNTLSYYQYTEHELRKGLANAFILSK